MIDISPFDAFPTLYRDYQHHNDLLNLTPGSPSLTDNTRTKLNNNNKIIASRQNPPTLSRPPKTFLFQDLAGWRSACKEDAKSPSTFTRFLGKFPSESASHLPVTPPPSSPSTPFTPRSTSDPPRQTVFQSQSGSRSRSIRQLGSQSTYSMLPGTFIYILLNCYPFIYILLFGSQN